MGITKLADLIHFSAPDAIIHKDISDYAGKVIAVDIAVVVNQFRAATPTQNPLTGLFFRTLTFLEHDIKPVFVFDGKPPSEKTAVLEKRAAAARWMSPKLTGTASALTKDCFRLLELLGVPFIQAPGDAEALCAQLVKNGTVYAVASEDMDTLPFGASILLRQLNANKNSDVTEYSLPKLLEKLQISHEEFVDLCILLGCDYCDKIRGLGPKRALTLIQKYHTIENVVLNIKRQTHPIPQFWKYREARKLFLDAPQTVAPQLKWTEPDEEGLVRFLCHVKNTKVKRIRHRMESFRQKRDSNRNKCEKEKGAGKSNQTKLDSYFRLTRKRSKPVEAASSLSSNRKKLKST